MIRPPFLKPGDKIAIVAPGRKVSFGDIDVAIQHFSSWGLEVVCSKNLFSTDENYLSGTDEQRLDDYQTAIDDPSIRAIINARGGYGSTRVIDRINFDAFKKGPKWVVGFSDITAILLKLFRLGYESIHGTMPIVFSKPDALESIHSLKHQLFGDLRPLSAPPFELNRNGEVSGIVVGGNLSLVVDSLGTSSEIDTKGKILFIEEIDEYLYKMDRMIVHLKRAGKLDNLAGLIVGHMTDPLDTELKFGHRIEEIILHHTHNYHYPVTFKFPSGHENPNLAWFHGGHALLQVNDLGTTLSYNHFMKINS